MPHRPVSSTALRLVSINSDNKIELNQATLSKIREITHPISVLSVIGPYRSGKSFLLNLLCEGRTKFATGSSTNPCTQGVLVDILVPKPEVKEPCKILMDTEGLFSFNRNESFDMMLFLFTALTSSVMIYNSFSMIDERALENFAFLTQIASVFAATAKNKLSGARAELLDDQVKNLFPSFVWLLRDFALDLRISDDGQVLTPDEYLEYALMIRPKGNQREGPDSRPQGKTQDGYPVYRRSYIGNQKGDLQRPSYQSPVKKDTGLSLDEQELLKNSEMSSITDQQKNLIRKAIKGCFQTRRCFTLVRPVNDERVLQRIDQAKEEEIREEFLTGLEAISDYINSEMKPKRVKDVLMTGEAFADFLIMIAEAINANSVPPIENILVSSKGPRNSK